jgi:hypothetical protein
MLFSSLKASSEQPTTNIDTPILACANSTGIPVAIFWMQHQPRQGINAIDSNNQAILATDRKREFRSALLFWLAFATSEPVASWAL